jgi:Tfp pilus assembly protein PilF
LAEAVPEERAQYLVEAAVEWAAAGEPDHARTLFEAAIADGGPVVGDARAFYAGFLFDTGQPDHALHQLAELRASHPTEPTTYVCAGEVEEEAGDLDGALRWFTAGLTRFYGDFDVADALDDTALMQLLNGRRRIRQHLEQPADHWDELGARAQAILIERLAGD